MINRFPVRGAADVLAFRGLRHWARMRVRLGLMP
jgi:hypothetical protein